MATTPAVEPVPRPPLPKAFMAGPLVGYRLWPLYAKDGECWLESYGMLGQRWWPGAPVVAACVRANGGSCGGAPAAGHTCGLHALRSREGLRAYSPSPRPAESAGGRLVALLGGEVALWGRVIEHTDGYRAQYGYPLRLWVHREGTMPGFPEPRWLRNLVTRVQAVYGLEESG